MNVSVSPESQTVPERWEDVRSDRFELRDKLAARLRAEGRLDLANRLVKCGKRLTLRCAACTAGVETFTRCDLKWCPSCQHALAARTADRYARIMHAVQWPLRVTLTAENFAYDCSNAVRELRRAWGKLRRLRWFVAKVRGGVVGFEVTDTGKGFHVHAHALFDCKWFAVTTTAPRVGADKETWKKKARAAAKEVAQQWSLCCGRPASMQVRRVWTRDGGDIRPALVETLKYSTKGSDLVESARSASAIIDQLDRTRMITSFGTCHGLPEFKRQRSAPKMCACGCSEWLPEDVLERQSLTASGLRSSRRK